MNTPQEQLEQLWNEARHRKCLPYGAIPVQPSDLKPLVDRCAGAEARLSLAERIIKTAVGYGEFKHLDGMGELLRDFDAAKEGAE